jgi:hypothetical protein
LQECLEVNLPQDNLVFFSICLRTNKTRKELHVLPNSRTSSKPKILLETQRRLLRTLEEPRFSLENGLKMRVTSKCRSCLMIYRPSTQPNSHMKLPEGKKRKRLSKS